VASTASDPSAAKKPTAPPTPPAPAPVSSSPPQGADTTIIAANPAAIAAPTPAPPKAAPPKGPANERATGPATDPDSTTANGNPPTSIVQPATVGKATPDNATADATSTAAAIGSPPIAAGAATPHEHSADPAGGHSATDLPDPNVQLPGAIQPQVPSAATAAVPAANLTAMAANSPAVPLSGLALEIAASARNGKSRFDIRLDPAELGRIDVRIDVDRNGQMTSHLTVEKPETLSMLQQDAPQLQRALDNAGFRTGDGGLQFSLRDQSSGQNSGNQTIPNAQRLIIAEDETIPAASAGRSYGRMAGSGSGVDIRV